MPLSFGAIRSPSWSLRHAFEPDLTSLERDDDAPFAKLPCPFPPRDQDGVLCCVSCSVVLAMESMDARRDGGLPGGGLDPVEAQRDRSTELSPLFLHYTTTGGKNTPVSVDAVLESAKRFGVCRASAHRRSISRRTVDDKPSSKARRNAMTYRLKGKRSGCGRTRYYNRLSSRGVVKQWKALLRSECPVLCVFRLSPAYYRLGERCADGLPLEVFHAKPRRFRSTCHCVAIMGYSDDVRSFLVVDSRGTDWGNAGTWWLPYELAGSSLVEESWTINDLTYD
ncbi:MAG: hypothetical protein AAGI53_06570 [Planctomycetota bacterium]